MRFLSRLAWAAGLLALVALAACSGEQEEATPVVAQTEQESVDQQSQARAEPEARSDRGVAESGEANQTERAQPQDEPTAQSEHTQSETTDQQAEIGDLNAAAQAALEAWSRNVSILELVVDVAVASEFFNFGTVTEVALQIEPLIVWVQVALPEELAVTLGGDSMQMLLSEEGAYLSMEQFEGWVDFGAVAGVDIMALLGTTGFDPNALTNLEQLVAPFDCLNAVGGEIREDTFEGRPVWMLDCDIDPELMTQVADELANSGLALPSGGVEVAALRIVMAIERDSGAPLLIDSDMTVLDPQSGAESQVRSIARLLSWNQPLEFPTPEPLVDPSVLELMSGPATYSDSAAQPGSDVFSPEAQLALVEAWLAETDALALAIQTDATIAGESRSADTIVLRSVSQGKFETATTLDEGVTIRLLWTRDGLWLSEADDLERGDPQWTPTDPTLLGLGSQTVDEFLAEEVRIEFGVLRPLLESAYVERTQDANGVRYRVTVEQGGMVAGDGLHGAAAGFLREEAAELLVEDVGIGEIYGLSVTLDLIGEQGEFEQSVVRAEFNTELGLVALRSTARNISESGWTFSSP